jgi:Flp pilus assembly protein TadB
MTLPAPAGTAAAGPTAAGLTVAGPAVTGLVESQAGSGVGLVVAVVCGVGLAVGLLLVVASLPVLRRARRSGPGDGPGGSLLGPTPEEGGAWSRLRTWQARRSRDPVLVRGAVAVAVGLLVTVGTRWVVAGVAAGVAAWVLPGVLRRDTGPDGRRARIARIEAIAAWAEMLRDVLSAAAGLEQAIQATAPIAPAPIRDPVRTLAERIERGRRLPEALQAFADDLDDPTADLVVAALVLASRHQARDLAELLARLATASREQVAMRLRVEAGRARARTSARIIIGFTLLMITGLVLLNRGYLTPYDTPLGQLVLLLVAGIFAAAMTWMTRLARLPRPPRVLTRLTAPPLTAPVSAPVSASPPGEHLTGPGSKAR